MCLSCNNFCHQKVSWNVTTHQKVLNLRPVYPTRRWNPTKVFKLRQDTGKTKIFADQIEGQAKRKLELIKRKQELEEAETLNAVAEAKEKL